jgi:hypothetical protein
MLPPVVADRDPLMVFFALLLLAILVGGLIGALVRFLRKPIHEHMRQNSEK